MGISFFGWLRRQAREAVLGGIGDAMEQLGDARPGDTPAELPELLRARLALAAPAIDEEPARAKRSR